MNQRIADVVYVLFGSVLSTVRVATLCPALLDNGQHLEGFFCNNMQFLLICLL